MTEPDWDALAASRDDVLARAVGERHDLRKTAEDVADDERWAEREREREERDGREEVAL